MATTTAQTCDANATAVETGVIVVLTRLGPIVLCAHHFNQHAPEFAARNYPAAYLRDDEPADLGIKTYQDAS